MKKAQQTMPSGCWVRSLLVLSLGALLGAGCASVPQSLPQSRIRPPEGATLSPALAEINRTLATEGLQAPAASADYRLGPEDLLQITLFNVPESEAGVIPRRVEVRVSQEGMITLPLLGDTPAAGLTTSALEQSLRKRYDKYLHNPQVGVHVVQYHGQRLSVIGAVQRPGVFELTGPKTLADLLAMAGGVSGNAGSQVHIYRHGPEGRHSYVIDLLSLARNGASVNLSVQAGDVISVPQAGKFFVDGAVGRPGSYPLDSPYRLTQALATAGGVNDELAKTSEILILRRRDASEVERIVANLREILAGGVVDPPIEADDMVFVPTSTPKYLVKRFLGTIGLGGVGSLPAPYTR